MMKKLLLFGGVILVVVGIGLAAVVLYIDAIAKTAVERNATYALGVTTSLNSADVRILRGEFAMSGLNVANPEGYSSPHFLDMSDGQVAVTLGSLMQETVQLPHLTLDGIDINLESRGGKSNFDVILANLKKSEAGDPTGKPEPKEDGKRFVISRITISNVMVHVNMMPEAGALTELHLPIELIELENVGSDTTGGMLLSDLSGVLIKTILVAVLNKAGELPGFIVAGLETGLSELGSVGEIGVKFAGEALVEMTGQLGKFGEGIGQGLDGVGRQLDDGIGGIGRGLGGLLGGQKDPDDDDDDDSDDS